MHLHCLLVLTCPASAAAKERRRRRRRAEAAAASAAFISAPAQHYPGAVAVGGDGVVARGRHSVAFFLDLYRRRRRRQRRRGMRPHSSTLRRYFEIDSGQAGMQAGRTAGPTAVGRSPFLTCLVPFITSESSASHPGISHSHKNSCGIIHCVAAVFRI